MISSKPELEALVALLGDAHVDLGDAISPDAAKDESLHGAGHAPAAVVRPVDAAEVAAVVRFAAQSGIPLVPRGAATGLSGGCRPEEGSVVLSTERMSRILEVDPLGHTATVEPGVTLAEVNAAAAQHGLVYPVFPGTDAGSIGGTIATNAGGMRAVRYGVTRQNVLGVEIVTGTGDIVRAGGRLAKNSSGYDLTQLIVGSEGTLGIVTQATLKLQPLLDHSITILAPFDSLDAVARMVPRIVGSGMQPSVLEYIDRSTMTALLAYKDLRLGVPSDVLKSSEAHLVVVLENRDQETLDRAVDELATMLADGGALDVYVLEGTKGLTLLELRESAFWMVKANGADDLIDMAVPRALIPEYLMQVKAIAKQHGARVYGCGHAGDGNIHFSVYEKDDARRHELLLDIFRAGILLGGTISGEHGIGRDKRVYYEALTDPVKLALERRIKSAFDPAGVLNPGAVFVP
ncbi:FAD-binding oxidoreductase [Microbacterium sp. A588]